MVVLADWTVLLVLGLGFAALLLSGRFGVAEAVATMLLALTVTLAVGLLLLDRGVSLDLARLVAGLFGLKVVLGAAIWRHRRSPPDEG